MPETLQSILPSLCCAEPSFAWSLKGLPCLGRAPGGLEQVVRAPGRRSKAIRANGSDLRASDSEVPSGRKAAAKTGPPDRSGRNAAAEKGKRRGAKAGDEVSYGLIEDTINGVCISIKSNVKSSSPRNLGKEQVPRIGTPQRTT